MIIKKMNTRILPLIQPGLYGTILGDFYEDVREECQKDFKDILCYYGEEAIENIINENLVQYNDIFKGIKISNVIFKSPQWYNFKNDWFEFDMEVTDNFVDVLKEKFEKSNDIFFFLYCAENFGSRDGFISFYPTTKENFEKAFTKESAIACVDSNENADFCRALSMLLMYLLEIYECDFNEYQSDFENKVIEEVAYNGWLEDEDYE